jgi:glycopeptide antibiotics resistance protein
MLDGRWLYVAALPLVLWIVTRRTGLGRRLIALVALAHVVILANVALFPIPLDPALVAADRLAAAAFPGNGGLELIPFATIGPLLAGDAPGQATRIAILNVFVLTPAGLYLPLLFGSLRSWPGLVLLAVGGGLSVEVGQLAISSLLGFPYRTVDIDDVILNAIGIVVGWMAARLAIRARERRARHDREVRDPTGGDQAPATNR